MRRVSERCGVAREVRLVRQLRFYESSRREFATSSLRNMLEVPPRLRAKRVAHPVGVDCGEVEGETYGVPARGREGRGREVRGRKESGRPSEEKGNEGGKRFRGGQCSSDDDGEDGEDTEEQAYTVRGGCSSGEPASEKQNRPRGVRGKPEKRRFSSLSVASRRGRREHTALLPFPGNHVAQKHC